MVAADWNMCCMCNNCKNMQYDSYVYISEQNLLFLSKVAYIKIDKISIICSQDKHKHNVYLKKKELYCIFLC